MSVKLFQPRSLTQTFTYYWMNLPKFIPKCAEKSLSPLERLKNTMIFAVSGLYFGSMQLKPFNPLISETFQGYFDVPDKEKEGKERTVSETLVEHKMKFKCSEWNNRAFRDFNTTSDQIESQRISKDAVIEVYTEQISNYPTVTRFYVKNKHFIMHGYFDISLKVESFGNKIITFTKGYTCVEFPEIGEKIMYSMPNAKLLNAISKTDRSAFYIGLMSFVDVKNSLRGLVYFGRNEEKIHEIQGCIFKHKFDNHYSFNFDVEYNKYKKIKIKKEIGKDIVAYMTGSWLEQLKFDNKIYWDIKKDKPTWIKPCTSCLPSDSRFREDLIWLFRSFYCAKNEKDREKYEKLANEWKLILEKLQRIERENKAKQAEEREKLRKKNK